MIWRVALWGLLVSHFFAAEPFREHIFAVQTVLCAIHSRLTPIHIVTVFMAVIYFVQTEHRWIWWTFLVHHVIVAGCVVGEYAFKEWRHWNWILLGWSVRWLSSLDIYDSPIRATIRCVVFGLVARGRFAKTFKDGFKWCWILLVHELAWAFLPLQMLYEVYMHKETELPVTV